MMRDCKGSHRHQKGKENPPAVTLVNRHNPTHLLKQLFPEKSCKTSRVGKALKRRSLRVKSAPYKNSPQTKHPLIMQSREIVLYLNTKDMETADTWRSCGLNSALGIFDWSFDAWVNLGDWVCWTKFPNNS